MDFGKENIPYDKAYKILQKMGKGRKNGWVEIIEYRRACASTPGVRYDPGDTFPIAISKMESWGWIEVDDENRLVRIDSD